MRTTSVRRYYPESDASFVSRLAAEAFAEFSRRVPVSVAQLVATGTTLIAEREGQPVGFAVVEFPDASKAYLSAIAVSYEQRGRGMGRLLLAASERLSLERGAKVLELSTADSNLEALHLFLKCGFRIVRRRDGFYGRGQAACILSLALSCD